MRLLVDTHALLWFAADDRRLGRRAAAAMEAEDAELLVSVASVWELAIKIGAGRLKLPVPLERFVSERLDEGFQLCHIDWTHAAAVAHLPHHHRDSFDRLLAAQALAENMRLVTRDRVFRRYGVETIW